MTPVLQTEGAHAPGLTRPLLISLEDVSIAYEDVLHPAVRDIDFHLHQGESVLFMGPSGCGKSTLAMLCAHLIPRSVEAVVSGRVWHDARVQTPGQVGYVFQDPDAQFCMLTVADEVAFGLENQSFPPGDMLPRIHQALTAAGLSVSDEASHAHFSGGMKQMLAIACALALRPNLLIFDEPTANLDPLSTRQVFDQIAHLHGMGQTMIVIEHKFDALLPHMDRVVLFDKDGAIYRTGATAQVIREEWSWLVQEGIVAPWKQRPGEAGGTELPRAGLARVADHARPKVSSGPQNAYTLRDVSLRYGDQLVWTDVSLAIKKGEFVAIVGPNGAGKSSLLEVLAGLQRPTCGAVEMLGKVLNEWRTRERFATIAYCFQNPEFQFIYQRVGDELANRIVADSIPHDIAELLRQFGLAGLEQRSPFALSQGQKRRLSVAALLREEHEIYLLDEPTFGQDARTQQAILERMRALNADGKTIILTTHDMDLVTMFASMVIVVAEGKILFQGTVQELYAYRDVLQRAHLLADVSPYQGRGDAPATATTGGPARREIDGSNRPSLRARRAPIHYLHPAWLLSSLFAATLIALFAHTLPQSIAMLAIPYVLMVTVAWMSPWKVLKLIAPFILLYLLYMWSIVANAAVPPGTKTISILWYHLSWYGFNEGVILSLRTLGSVLFAMMFTWSIDFTDLIIGACKDFRVPPKFAYGMMAGLRVVPLFKTEWTKLRQARQVRGKDARMALLRPITYALPILSQGIRMSERVAIAMEARGFFDIVTQSARERTFFRPVRTHWWDYAASVALIALTIGALVLFRS